MQTSQKSYRQTFEGACRWSTNKSIHRALSDLLSGHGGDVGHDDLVDEGAESEPEVGGDVLHGGGEEVSERRELLLVVLHRLGEVHEVVEVNRVVLGLLVEKVQVVSLVCKEKM